MSSIVAFTLSLLRERHSLDKGFLLWSGDSGCYSSIYIKDLPATLDGTGTFVCFKGVSKNAISAPKLDDFLFQLFRVRLAWQIIGLYHSDILEPYHNHKASNHPISPV